MREHLEEQKVYQALEEQAETAIMPWTRRSRLSQSGEVVYSIRA